MINAIKIMKPYLLAILFFSFSFPQIKAETSQPNNPYLKAFPKDGALLIKIPAFKNKSWEESLVTYPVEFRGANLKPENLVLKNSDKAEVPFQLSEIRNDPKGFLLFGKLSFITNQKQNQETIFRLLKGPSKIIKSVISKTEGENGIVINNGRIKILIPKSLKTAKDIKAIPSPILSINAGDKWEPSATLSTNHPKLLSIISETQEEGKVFLTHAVEYNFSGGSKYKIFIKVIHNMETIVIDEEFKGLKKNFSSDSLDSIRQYISFQNNNNSISLDDAKDWIFPQADLKSVPPEFLISSLDGKTSKIIENAYKISKRNQTAITEYDCLQLAETGFLFPDHPSSREWLDQAEKNLRTQKARSTSLPKKMERLELIIKCVVGLQNNQIIHYDKIKKPLGQQPDGSVVLSRNENEKVIVSSTGEIKAEGQNFETSSYVRSSLEDENQKLLAVKALNHVDLGEVVMTDISISKNDKFSDRRRILNIDDLYTVTLENLRSPNSKNYFSGKTDKPKVFFTRSHDSKLKIVEENSSIISLSEPLNNLNGFSVIPKNEKISVNKISSKSEPIIAYGPFENVALIDTEKGSDRLFRGNGLEQLTLTTDQWAVNSSLALIRELGNNKNQLSVFGNNESSTNSISTNHITLEVEGNNIAATAEYRVPKKSKTRDPIVFNSSGKYYAPDGGTIRIMFGKNSKATELSEKKLLAFWKFDEGMGEEFVDIKDPQIKGILKSTNNNNKFEWVEGIGFGKGSAIKLNPSKYIDTGFEKVIPKNSSISIWVKTTKSGNLVNLIQDDANPKSSSKILRITKEGTVEISQKGNNPFQISGESKINDGKWHHVTWTTKEFLDESIIEQSNLKHSLYVDSELQKEISIKKNLKDLENKYRVTIGHGKVSTSSTQDISGIDGCIDNMRIYNFALSQEEIHGITMVGLKRSPIAITSLPQKMIRVGEEFEYSLKYTGGGPFVRFTFNNVPKWARVEGRIIGTPTQRDLGLSKPINIVGMSQWGPGQQSFSLSVQPPLVTREWKIHANGKQLLTKYIGNGVEAQLPKGTGQWKFTKEKPDMRPPLIMKVENTSSGINFQIRGTPGVTNYLFESSKDSGKTWQSVVKGKGLRHKTNALKNGDYLLRVSAIPAAASPVISSTVALNLNNAPPSKPQRPEVFPSKNSIRLKWDHHIGATEYNVFRRKLGDSSWDKIYNGKSLGFIDKEAKGSLEKFDLPGLKEGANYKMEGLTIYEYCISCIDKNGESPKSMVRNSDPRNW